MTPTLSPPPPLWGLDGGEKVLAIVGLLLILVGLASAARAFLRVEPGDPPRLRTYIAVYAFARGGFWISLGAIFLAYAFRGVFPGEPRVLFPIPLVMAGIRLVTAQALNRRLPNEPPQTNRTGTP
ncbi:MAG: hypothetical protein WD770_08835 [Actinomycetota bacterium]